MRFGITGHRQLPAAAVDLAARHWASTLRVGPPPHGVSSLAEGADQLFAEYLLAVGGTLEVIEPCADYANALAGDARARYQRLHDAAAEVTTLPYPGPSPAAYLAAGLVVVKRCDLLFAVWDGLPARGPGGTGDVVGHARARGRQVTVLWPPQLRRA
jgi:hypothetical protein